MKKTVSALLFFSLFGFLLLFPQKSFAAAQGGLLLWYEHLVPTLFPAMLFSRILLESDLAYVPMSAAARPFTRLLGISPYGFYALVTGFLCGCPMGVKILADLYKSGRISRREAAYLARFCGNISPAFISSYLVLKHLKDGRLIAPSLCILFGAPLLFGLFSHPFFFGRPDRQTQPQRDRKDKNKAPATAISFAMVDACITDSILSTVKLGGYIVLFAVSGAFLDALPLRTVWLKAALKGICEVSTGIDTVSLLPLPFSRRYPALIAVTAFGGLCCAAQSSEMLSRIGLSLRSYLAARCSIAAAAVLMAALFAARCAL